MHMPRFPGYVIAIVTAFFVSLPITFAVLNLALWGYIWDIPGMFLCVPFLIIVTIILSHFPYTRPIAIILSSDGRLRVPVDKTFGPFALNPSENSLLTADEEREGES